MPMGELTRRGRRARGPDRRRGRTSSPSGSYEAPDWPTRFALLERAIAARVLDAPPVAPELEWAWQRLIDDRRRRAGRRAGARSSGCSRRHLAASFREQSACRRRRWRGCCGSSAPSSGCAAAPTWRTLALDCGYYDQAHFNRDFRAFAGVTPTEYRVTSVQDISACPPSVRAMIIPTLRYKDAKAAIDFLDRAFGFERHAVHEVDGVIGHAELHARRGMVMLGTAGQGDPQFETGRTSIYVVVDDPDALYERAKARGRGDHARAPGHGLRLARVLGQGSRGQRLELRDVRSICRG